MELFCHYCHDWLEVEQCQPHFESVHGQSNVTFENLKKRMEVLGGLTTRETPTETVLDEEQPKPKNWLFRDKDDSTGGVFVTNNFRHRM